MEPDPAGLKPVAQRVREAIFCVAREFRLTRAERLEVAAYVLNREVSSYTELSPVELGRMLDAFQGAKYIATIKIEHRRGQRH